LKVILLEAAVVAVTGLNDAVTPFGNPVAAKLTLPEKPLMPLTLMVLLPLPERGMVRLVGEAAKLKLGTTTVKEIGIVLFSMPEVPVMVSG
jgi:hypothetical protein